MKDTSFVYTLGNRPADLPFPTVDLVPIHYNHKQDAGMSVMTAPKRKAIIDVNTGNFFQVVSDNYALVPHESVLDAVEESLGQGNMKDFGTPEIKVQTSKNGALLHAEYRFPEIKLPIDQREIGDVVSPVINITNSYDMSSPLKIFLGAYRLVCKNGMVASQTYMDFNKRHRTGVFEFQDQDMLTAMNAFESQVKQWREWKETLATPEHYRAMASTMVLGKKGISAIDQALLTDSGVNVTHKPAADGGDGVELYNVEFSEGLSLWGLFNAMTWYTTHQVKSTAQRLYLEDQLRKSLRAVAA